MSKESHVMKQAAIDEIARLAKANGGKIQPEEIVQAATSEDSPLHDYFQWNDTIAAHNFRVMQARVLIRSVHLHITINERKLNIPKYVRDPGVDRMEQGYIETSRVKNDEDMTREVLINEFNRIGAALKRARQLGEFFGLTADIDRMTSDLGLLKNQVEVVGRA